jgi:hypothetical protein
MVEEEEQTGTQKEEKMFQFSCDIRGMDPMET